MYLFSSFSPRLVFSFENSHQVLHVHAEDGDKGNPREIRYGLVSEGNPFTSFFDINDTTGKYRFQANEWHRLAQCALVPQSRPHDQSVLRHSAFPLFFASSGKKTCSNVTRILSIYRRFLVFLPSSASNFVLHQILEWCDDDGAHRRHTKHRFRFTYQCRL